MAGNNYYASISSNLLKFPRSIHVPTDVSDSSQVPSLYQNLEIFALTRSYAVHCLSVLTFKSPSAMKFEVESKPLVCCALKDSGNLVFTSNDHLKFSVKYLQKYTNELVPNAPTPSSGIALYSKEFYGACTVGGILACGVTHTMVTPLDVVKCRRQVSLYS